MPRALVIRQTTYMIRHMKKLVTLLAAVAAISLVSTASAEEKSLKGEGLCAKCALKQTSKCQDAIRVEENGKKVVYYIEKNDVSKGLHDKVCSATVEMEAKGKVTEKEGKKWIALSKLETK